MVGLQADMDQRPQYTQVAQRLEKYVPAGAGGTLDVRDPTAADRSLPECE